MFVCFEGIDASGKDYYAGKLYKKMTAGGQRLSSKLIKKKDVDERDRLGASVNGLLFPIAFPTEPERLLSYPPYLWILLAAGWYRAFYLERVKPALGDHSVVIVNNWFYKIMARYEYKGLERGWLQSIFRHVPSPDVVFFLDVTAEESSRRRQRFTDVESGVYDGFAGGSAGFREYQTRIAKVLQTYSSSLGWHVVETACESAALREMVKVIRSRRVEEAP